MHLDIKTIRDTSPQVASIMLSVGIDFIKPNFKILEPSAGEGNLVDFIAKAIGSKNNIDVIELNADKVNTLKEKGYNVIGRDYMNTSLENTYDVIIACPPFKDNANLYHIQKMYTDVKDGGYVLTLCNSQWITDNSEKSVSFRKFLLGKKYSITMLPDNSFMEKGKTVPTILIKMQKTVFKPSIGKGLLTQLQ